MMQYQYAYRSLTGAQQAAWALKRAGLTAEVHRSEGACGGRQCGYSVYVPLEQRQAVEDVLCRRGLMAERSCEAER